MYKLFDKTTKTVQRKLSYSKIPDVKEIMLDSVPEEENETTLKKELLSKNNSEKQENSIQKGSGK